MMKTRKLFPLFAMGLALAFTACSDDDEKNDIEVYQNPFEVNADKISAAYTNVKLKDTDLDPVITTYVNDVVIPTYKMMYDNVSAFQTAVNKLNYADTEKTLTNNLADACEAWRNARTPWEESEAFLYGPAARKNLDPSLDSWPLDQDGIDQVLASGDFGNVENGDVDEDDEKGPQNTRGFHTAEYLLFSEGAARTAANIKDATHGENMIKYVKTVAKRMMSDTEALYESWKSGISGDDADGCPTPFGAAMIAHTGTYTYQTASAVVADIFNEAGGMPAIANEVGETKIGEPFNYWNEGKKEQAVLKVESWFSWNSLEDYENNIISIENCYMGRRSDDSSTAAATNCFHNIVNKLNPVLDELIVKQIKTTRKAIKAIPYPLRNNLDKSAAIKNAQNECAALVDGLNMARRAILKAAE